MEAACLVAAIKIQVWLKSTYDCQHKLRRIKPAITVQLDPSFKKGPKIPLRQHHYNTFHCEEMIIQCRFAVCDHKPTLCIKQPQEIS